jgi:hypothetical protein
LTLVDRARPIGALKATLALRPAEGFAVGIAPICYRRSRNPDDSTLGDT